MNTTLDESFNPKERTLIINDEALNEITEFVHQFYEKHAKREGIVRGNQARLCEKQLLSSLAEIAFYDWHKNQSKAATQGIGCNRATLRTWLKYKGTLD